MKKQKDNVIPMVDPEREARQNFASHVQSIAFNLTLSRRMIDCLQAVRDYGWPSDGQHYDASMDRERKEYDKIVTRIHHRDSKEFRTHNFVGFMGALSNRGLVYWSPNPYDKRKKGERSMLLSHAGELVCELLVEAGLMAPGVEVKKQASK